MLSMNPHNCHISTGYLWIAINVNISLLEDSSVALGKSLNLSNLVFLIGKKNTQKSDVILSSIISPSWKLRDCTLNGSRIYKNESLHWCEQWITQKIVSHWIFLKQSISAYKLETHKEGREDPIFHLSRRVLWELLNKSQRRDSVYPKQASGMATATSVLEVEAFQA